MKKKLLNIFLVFALVIPAFFLCACGNGGDNDDPKKFHDNTKWFTEEELSAVGLSNLTAPVGLSGAISSSDYWFGDGYSFSQPCENDDILTQNAKIYLDYFKSNYDGYFGVSRLYGNSTDFTSTYHQIVQKNDISNYFDDNPSKLYKFYYVTNKEKDDNGYFVKGSVYTFEIRYEFDTTKNQYLFKLFIEKADTSHNNTISHYYKMA